MVGACNNSDVKTVPIPEQEKQLRELISQYPDSFLLKENLVQYFRDNGNYDKAISETDKALKKDSLNSRLLDIKATLHFENGDTTDAIRSFEKAISIDPKPEYIISLGSLYAQTKNPVALE
ncbi:MAG: tetratricopeptide repeat protein, partial [Ferruginibacter sp.]